MCKTLTGVFIITYILNIYNFLTTYINRHVASDHVSLCDGCLLQVILYNLIITAFTLNIFICASIQSMIDLHLNTRLIPPTFYQPTHTNL